MVRRGPLLYRVPSLETQIAAGTIGQPQVGTARLFRAPRDVIVTGLFPLVLQATLADLAGLELAVYVGDEPLVWSGRRMVSGTDPSESVSFVSALALVGRKHRWFPVDLACGPHKRPIRFCFRNVGANAVDPVLFLRIADA